jgi:hypothetical protein
VKTNYHTHRKLKFARSWQRGGAILLLGLFAAVIWIAYAGEGDGIVRSLTDWLSQTWARLTR